MEIIWNNGNNQEQAVSSAWSATDFVSRRPNYKRHRSQRGHWTEGKPSFESIKNIDIPVFYRK